MATSKKLAECGADTPKFSFSGDAYQSKCVKVYDGDTITVVLKPRLDSQYWKFNIRLLSINTAEIRNRDEDEKKKAYAARDFLREKILGKIVTIKCGDFDAFGRILATVFLDDENINELMLDTGHATPFLP